MDVDDWPLTGDCGDTDASLPRFAMGGRLPANFTPRTEPGYPPYVLPAATRCNGLLHRLNITPSQPNSLPFWGGTP